MADLTVATVTVCDALTGWEGGVRMASMTNWLGGQCEWDQRMPARAGRKIKQLQATVCPCPA